MLRGTQWMLLHLLTLLAAINVKASQLNSRDENGVNSAVFLSPKFVLGPGSVENKFYHNIDFPRGHIGLKEFNAEVVDDAGNPVPLHETYLHHWVVDRYYALRDVEVYAIGNPRPRTIRVRNSGICKDRLGQYFGLGSETRKTATYVPDPYGIEVGNPEELPEGYKERWLLNVHAIDTRSVEDRLGCTECRCDLYNITIDEYGQPLKSGYEGGLYCCYDQTQCRVKKGVTSIKRSLYLRYTVKWVNWEDNILPVKIYILDVTDTGHRDKGFNNFVGLGDQIGCMVEYEVKPCGVSGVPTNHCIDNKQTSMIMPKGGYIIYGVAHLHSGGIGAALYGEDGRTICSSMAVYGNGKEAGNEDGYIIGMSTCYPQPGSIKIYDGETLYLESNYSSGQRHTGVMGLFYILVADRTPPKHALLLRTPIQATMKLSKYSWAVVSVGVVMIVVTVVGYRKKTKREEGYQSLAL